MILSYRVIYRLLLNKKTAFSEKILNNLILNLWVQRIENIVISAIAVRDLELVHIAMGKEESTIKLVPPVKVAVLFALFTEVSGNKLNILQITRGPM